jgi:RNA polymerase sigma-70 factor (ECF subfamily)
MHATAISNDCLATELASDLLGSFEQLVLAYQHRLYAFALRMTSSPQDAEEIAQDAFVRAFRALEGYDAPRIADLALRPWLYQITLNVTRNRLRGKRLAVVSLDADEDGGGLDPPDDEQAQPEAVWERTERRGELGTLVSALPDRFRAAVILRHVEGLGYGELAQVLDQPVGTVKANVHRGVNLLRAALAGRVEEV